MREAGESDVDILVEFEPGKSLLDLAGLKIELEETLGRKVDVLTYESLHPLLKDRILKEQKPILSERTQRYSSNTSSKASASTKNT